MGTRKKYEHGIFIGFDDKSKCHQVFIRRTKRILELQHVQTIRSTKEIIYKDLRAQDDVIIVLLMQRSPKVVVILVRETLAAKQCALI